MQVKMSSTVISSYFRVQVKRGASDDCNQGLLLAHGLRLAEWWGAAESGRKIGCILKLKIANCKEDGSGWAKG